MRPSTRTLTAVLALGANVSAAAAVSPEMDKALRENSTIYIATKRANGSRSTAAPVWFWWDGQNIYSTTSPDSHKGRRLKRGGTVYVSTDSADGPFVEGTAEVITDMDTVAKIGDRYNEKYWIAWMGFFRPRVERVRTGKTLAFKIVFPQPAP